jgi:putative pyruvate formate lyase activating enzyme
MIVDYEPLYIKTHRSGILKNRVHFLKERLKSCDLCPRQCHANRLSGERGYCSTGEFAVVSSYMPHFGEESPLVGNHGSGTIFFTHCNLLCFFCQNFDISHGGNGRLVSDSQLAEMMIRLQAMSCHNINFVTPSHVVPQILSALSIAIENGLNIPLVFNTGAYDLPDTLEMLEGIMDIYMPDMKFWDPGIAGDTCDAADYPAVMRTAVAEMFRQVGNLEINSGGIALKGLLVRHLVMPGRLADTAYIMEFLARKISPDTYVNIMPQYRPCGRAFEIPALNRPITPGEYLRAIALAREKGITRLDKV